MATCPELPSPAAISVSGATPDEVHERFDLPDSLGWLAASREDEVGRAYRAGVVARLGPNVSARALIERQRACFSRSNVEALARETKNASLVLSGAAGVIGAPSCVERRLFARQAARFPMLEHPTELGAFILRGNGVVRVYMSSMDRVGQKGRREIADAVAADVARGFALVAHLHNHPFLFDREIGDRMWTTPDTIDDVAGALAPSLSDAGFYQNNAEELPLEAAWITNGFESIHIPRAQFLSLATHERSK